MALSDEKLKGYVQRLLASRLRILCNHGFYGLLLMHMKYAVDENEETASTDGVRITFGTGFMDDLSDSELDFVMMHEILHVVLRHCSRGIEYDDEAFNIACDIVVNSNILLENGMDLDSITLEKYGEAMHFAKDGREGYEYTAEEVYQLLPIALKAEKGKGRRGISGNGSGKSEANGDGGDKGKSEKGDGSGTGKGDGDGKSNGRWDNHSQWGNWGNDGLLDDLWVKRFEDAAEAISIRDPSNARGTMPLFAQRLLEQLKKPQTDWRTVLSDFVQEDVVDYSFFPPDRRFDGGEFFMPDLNEKDDKVEKVLFMIDTSGSMSDKMITAAYSEVKGALDQFDGKLGGWLGFFDAGIIEPKPFSNEEEFQVIRPAGGGGTDFGIIFEYVRREMTEPPVSIIIMTDGIAPFPNEEAAMGIPVLWLLTSSTAKPPWGKVAHIEA